MTVTFLIDAASREELLGRELRASCGCCINKELQLNLRQPIALLRDITPGRHPDAVRKSGLIPQLMQKLLDLIVEEVCSFQFWNRNKDSVPLLFWRFMLDHLAAVLPFVSKETIPSYLEELLRKLHKPKEVDYWGVVAAATGIAPVTVRRTVDLSEHTFCREALENYVQWGLNFDTVEELATAVPTNNEWHRSFDEVPDDCQKYEGLFPGDEPIPGWNDLRDLLAQYPKLDPEPDYDPDIYRTSKSEDEPDRIREIFSDL